MRQTGSADHPTLAVTVVAARLIPETQAIVRQLLTTMLGLRTNLEPFYKVAAADRHLAPLVQQFRGLKPPRFPNVFEALVNAISCQQLSLTVGIELLNRIAVQCGPALSFEDNQQHAFPRPEDLLRTKAPTFRRLGFSYSKAKFLLTLSREIVAGHFVPEQLQHRDNGIAVEHLTHLHGVGRWTAEYVLLRGLGRTDTFPGDDVGARNRLASWLGLEGPLDYEGVQRAVRRWHPYAGLVYFHLLLAGLTQSGEMHRDAAA
ncbi:MAG: DNA-3-methyladenine glycosylase family protein [Acidobacteriaceae bacterium]